MTVGDPLTPFVRLEALGEWLANREEPLSHAEWAGVSYRIAKDKGWWDEPRSVGDVLMLMVTELAEALEEYRTGNALGYSYIVAPDGRKVAWTPSGPPYTTPPGKLEGFWVEIADLMVRIYDKAGEQGVDLEPYIRAKTLYNLTRPHRHGNKVL